VGDAQPAAAVAEHGIELVQLFHPAQHGFQLTEFRRAWLGGLEHRNLHHQLLALGQELVQGGIARANGHREAVQGAENPKKTRPLVPSRDSQSPSLNTWPLTRISRAFSSTSMSPAPATQHFPMPRVTTAAWLVMPPREVRMPAATSIP